MYEVLYLLPFYKHSLVNYSKNKPQMIQVTYTESYIYKAVFCVKNFGQEETKRNIKNMMNNETTYRNKF